MDVLHPRWSPRPARAAASGATRAAVPQRALRPSSVIVATAVSAVVPMVVVVVAVAAGTRSGGRVSRRRGRRLLGADRGVLSSAAARARARAAACARTRAMSRARALCGPRSAVPRQRSLSPRGDSHARTCRRCSPRGKPGRRGCLLRALRVSPGVAAAGTGRHSWGTRPDQAGNRRRSGTGRAEKSGGSENRRCHTSTVDSWWAPSTTTEHVVSPSAVRPCIGCALTVV